MNTIPWMTPLRLREVPSSLMASLVASPHLFVMQVRIVLPPFVPVYSLQTEFSVYVLLRLWVFLQVGTN